MNNQQICFLFFFLFFGMCLRSLHVLILVIRYIWHGIPKIFLELVSFGEFTDAAYDTFIVSFFFQFFFSAKQFLLEVCVKRLVFNIKLLLLQKPFLINCIRSEFNSFNLKTINRIITSIEKKNNKPVEELNFNCKLIFHIQMLLCLQRKRIRFVAIVQLNHQSGEQMALGQNLQPFTCGKHYHFIV